MAKFSGFVANQLKLKSWVGFVSLSRYMAMEKMAAELKLLAFLDLIKLVVGVFVPPKSQHWRSPTSRKDECE